MNWIDPLGLSWYDPSWVHKAIHRFARGADKVGHFVATHKQAVITAAVIIATLPLDETGIGEAIDADAIGADVTADGTADLVSDEMANEAAEEESAEAPEEAADQAPSCGAQSFTADTEVQLADGAKIPIRQVRVGDMVLATDAATGKTEAEPVTTLWVNHDDDLMDVTVRTASGTSTIHSTQHHLFWDLSTHAWVQAEHLSAGTALKTPNEATATVVGTTVIPGAAGMWDLTVANDHDFYVVVSAGSQAAVLVHNDSWNLSFKSQALRDSHFDSHVLNQGEFEGFGYTSPDEYEQGANEFFNNDDAVSVARPNGDQIFYRATTNEFGVVRAGAIATYFQSADGWSVSPLLIYVCQLESSNPTCVLFSSERL